MAKVSAPAKIEAARAAAPAAAPETAEKAAPRPRTRAKAPARSRRASKPAEEPKEEPQPATEAPAKPATTRPSDPPVLDGDPLAARLTLPMWRILHKALALARIEDGIDATVRIRAMIELWHHDPRFRARVDKLAKKRALSLHRGRPRKDRSA